MSNSRESWCMNYWRNFAISMVLFLLATRWIFGDGVMISKKSFMKGMIWG